jgi:signal transduction histidine kinase
MVQIVSEMLEFSRSGVHAQDLSPVDKIIHDAVLAMECRTGGVHIEVRRPGVEPMPSYRADSLFQVFCNLIKNAIDAMDGDGNLTISVGRRDRSIEIAFRDTGTGFTPEYAEEMFEPFFTTKGLGRGTGLGLAICRDIVEKLGGRITAVNNPERGSTFTVILPLPDL